MNVFQRNETNAPLPEDESFPWQAMQYVMGELSDEQMELFESAMADDVTLCEAVLVATRLSAGIAMAFESQRSVQPISVRVTNVEFRALPDRSVFTQFSVFMAAAAMGLALLTMVTIGNSRTVANMSQDAAVADALVALLHSAQTNDVQAEFDEPVDSDGSLSSLIVPEWLLTAVDLDAEARPEIRDGSGPVEESGVY
jgi:anti-sigma-K factor RskA